MSGDIIGGTGFVSRSFSVCFNHLSHCRACWDISSSSIGYRPSSSSVMWLVPYGLRISLRETWVQGLLLSCTCSRCFLFLLSNHSSILAGPVILVHVGISDGSLVIRIIVSSSSFTSISLESDGGFFWIDIVVYFSFGPGSLECA